VLLADDDRLALDAMRQALEDAGAQVTTADNAEAVRAHGDAAYDLYLFDLNLAGENGLRLLDELERRRGRRLDALVVTGATTSEFLNELRRSSRKWLTKPVTAAALVAGASGALTAVAQPDSRIVDVSHS
jgi:DNA-binding response OmpR family regulator